MPRLLWTRRETRQAASLQRIRRPSLLIPPAFVPLSQQEPPIPTPVALVAEHTQSFGKRPLEPLTVAFLHGKRLRTRRRLGLPFVDLRWHIDVRATFELRPRSIRQHRFDPLS